MDILQEAQESLDFPSCGRQYDGTKESKPIWSMPKASRDTEKKVFISNKHSQDSLGRDSPGFVYEPQRQKELPKWGFGTSAARPPLSKSKYPETSNNLLNNSPDFLKFKYKSRTAGIGVCPRYAASQAPDFNGYPMGAISPGPQRYDPQRCPPAVRLAHAPKVDEVPPKYSLRPRTKIRELESQTGPKVGPGSYPIPAACGEQPTSTKVSLPQWKLNQVDRFPEKRQHDSYRLWDAEGQQKIQYNRTFSSPPSYSFGTSTRGHVAKVAPVRTQLDAGPAGSMGPPHKEHPPLPPRREILKFSDVRTG